MGKSRRKKEDKKGVKIEPQTNQPLIHSFILRHLQLSRKQLINLQRPLIPLGKALINPLNPKEVPPLQQGRTASPQLSDLPRLRLLHHLCAVDARNESDEVSGYIGVGDRGVTDRSQLRGGSVYGWGGSEDCGKPLRGGQG